MLNVKILFYIGTSPIAHLGQSSERIYCILKHIIYFFLSIFIHLFVFYSPRGFLRPYWRLTHHFIAVPRRKTYPPNAKVYPLWGKTAREKITFSRDYIYIELTVATRILIVPTRRRIVYIKYSSARVCIRGRSASF